MLVVTAATLAVLIAANWGVSTGVSVSTGLKASLDALQEVPPQAVDVPRARGVLTGRLTIYIRRREISWQLTFAGLSGKALVAQVHLGKYGKSGPIGFQLCRPCRTGIHDRLAVTAKVVNAIKNGAGYVDVHTKKNPRGEIRGQIRLLTGA